VLVVDEAHANMRKVLLDHLEREPRIVVVGLTATPFTKGMGKVYASVVNPTTTNKQIEEGFLVPLKIYSCKAADMTNARTIAGEYVDSEVAERGKKIVGDIVSTWVEKTTEHFGGPVKSIVFTADVTHGADVCKAFTEAGYRFEQISYLDANQDRRDALITELRNPDSGLWGLVSCGVLTRGFDVTSILCGIDARPLRKSLSEVVQKIGRVQRAHEGKNFALWLDHAGNVERFGQEIFDLFENGVKSLDEADSKPPRKDAEESEKKEVFCPRCGLLRPGRALSCACGYEWPRKRTVEVVAGELREVTLNGRKLANSQWHLYEQIVTQNRGWGKPETVAGRSWHHFRQMAGVAPPRNWSADAVKNVEVSDAVAGKIHQMRIAYRKGRK
jgi:DNA repair protein RadD